MSQIAQFAKFTAKHGNAEAVLAALADAFLAAEKESGTSVYAVHVVPDEPDVIWMYELYDSVEHQQAHSSSTATAALRAAMSDLLEGPLEVVRGRLHQWFGLPEVSVDSTDADEQV